MSVEIGVNFVVAQSTHLDLQNAARVRKSGGKIGKVDCDKSSVDIFEMMSVWTAKYPKVEDSCGGNVQRDTMYDVIAPGCEDGSAIMIDDWTYMTKIEFP